MRRIFEWKRNRYVFSNKSKNEEKTTVTKIRNFFLGMIILFTPVILKALSSISFQASYWIGLMLRVIIFIPLLVVVVLIIRNIIMFSIELIENIIYKNISFILFIILIAHIIAVVLFIYAANYFKVISYVEDTVASCNHSYSTIEGKIIGVKTKYDTLSKKLTVCGAVFTIQNESGERKTITFNDTNLYGVVGMGDYCIMEYLPHSMLGMDLKIKEKHKWSSKIDEFLHEELPQD